MRPGNGVFLSVRPRFSRALFDGSKRVEVRRKALRIGPGTVIAVYETFPTMALSGFLLVNGVYHGTPAAVWSDVGRRSLLSRQEYMDYFRGSDHAFAFEVREALRLQESMPLRQLRRRCPGFMPPQSFCYLGSLPAALLRLLLEALRKTVSSSGASGVWASAMSAG